MEIVKTRATVTAIGKMMTDGLRAGRPGPARYRQVGRDRRLEHVSLREDERRVEGLDQVRKDPVRLEVDPERIDLHRKPFDDHVIEPGLARFGEYRDEAEGTFGPVDPFTRTAEREPTRQRPDLDDDPVGPFAVLCHAESSVRCRAITASASGGFATHL